MKSLRRPTNSVIFSWLESLPSAQPTFELDSSGPPLGFFEDCFRIRLGTGRDCYDSACHALRTWKMLPTQMASPVPESPPIEVDSVLSVMFRAGPLWTVNPCRIVEVSNQGNSNQESFSFTYVTLPGHIERGREQFSVELDLVDDSVWYSIHAFSRPAWWPVWFVLPYARHQQKKFRQLSGEAMRAVTCEATS